MKDKTQIWIKNILTIELHSLLGRVEYTDCRGVIPHQRVSWYDTKQSRSSRLGRVEYISAEG